ncbi:membrane-associated oxidoreductase [Actinomadura sp. WMMB 499]|uniref:membrane-associated oxidoreductase n=1 Tax=Actinomadura sp. WMMB 499 TaxID=1219491 RepID=UPI0012463DDE|nr:membrane-associated oxidoreductase [Actinomadura sp. WMMB 499]QFG24399.1 membrane-associated oxidoreductase [Actinomadura sp. WMMB 499]
MEPVELTAAERRVWRAFRTGEKADFWRDGDDVEDGGTWGPERTVRAWVLRRLLLRPREDGEVAALRVSGARIVGVLELGYATVEHPIRLWACHIEEVPNFYGSHLTQLNLSKSYLPGLFAATMHVNGVLRLTDCRVPGRMSLGGVRIARAIFLERARLGTPGTDQGEIVHLNHSVMDDDLWAPGLVAHGEIRLNSATITGNLNLEGAVLSNPGGRALEAESVSVGQNVMATRLRAEGEVNLRGARIGLSLELREAHFAHPVPHPQGSALEAENLTVGLDVRARQGRFDGEVDLRGATIPGQLAFSHARISHPSGQALRVSASTIGEVWLKDTRITGLVNLRRGRFGLLHVRPGALGGGVRLDGLTYESLAPRLPAKARIAMLERDVEGFVPHAYEQLAAAYLRAGDDIAARNVLLAKQRRRRRTLPLYRRVWGYVQDVTVGYGFRPLWAAAWLAGLVLAGTVAFGFEHPAPLKADEHPDFNPLFFSVDLLLPIIDFGQQKAFKPAGWHQWLGYTLISTGWVLATTIAAGVTRTLSRQ